MEREKIHTERGSTCQGVIRRLLQSFCCLILFSGVFFFQHLNAQERIEKQTKTFNVYGKQSRLNPGNICPYDTIYLSVILEDSSLTEIYYKWEASKDSGLSWVRVANAEMSYLIYPNPNEGIQFRCKASNEPLCLEKPDCEGTISYFKPVVSPLPKYRYQVYAGSCGKNNGKIDLTPFHSTEAPYSILWDNQITTVDLYPAKSGKHSLRISSEKGCIVNDLITVPEPESAAPEVVIELNNATCGLQNGSVKIRPFDARSVYEYEWSNGATDSFLTGLHVGKYGLKIREESGCERDTLITISNVTAPFFVKETHKDASCGLSNGSISIQANGTGKPFRFEWSTGDTLPSVKGLAPGFYNVTVLDKLGCKEELNGIQIKDKPAFTLGFETVSPACYGGDNGRAKIILPGSAEKYVILWSNGQTTAEVNDLPSGEYQVKVKELSSECVVSGIVVLDEPPPILAETSTTIEHNVAEVKVYVVNGKPPFLFQLNERLQDSSLFTNITETIAYIKVTDFEGCVASDTVLIDFPASSDPAHLPFVQFKNDFVETIYFAPNIITPNNDKSNDAFYIDAPGLNDAMIEIYDKAGRLIFAEYLSQSIFVGSAESIVCLAGLYYYNARLEYQNGEIRNIKGTFKIVRE